MGLRLRGRSRTSSRSTSATCGRRSTPPSGRNAIQTIRLVGYRLDPDGDRTRSGRRFAGLASIRARLTAAACLVVAGVLGRRRGHPHRPAPHPRREPRRRGGAAGLDAAVEVESSTLDTPLRVHGDEDAYIDVRAADGHAVARTSNLKQDTPVATFRPEDDDPEYRHREDPGARRGGQLTSGSWRCKRGGADLRRSHDLRRRQPRPRQGQPRPPYATSCWACRCWWRSSGRSPGSSSAAPCGPSRRCGPRSRRSRPRTWDAGCRCPSARRDRAPGHDDERHAEAAGHLGRSTTALRGRRQSHELRSPLTRMRAELGGQGAPWHRRSAPHPRERLSRRWWASSSSPTTCSFVAQLGRRRRRRRDPRGSPRRPLAAGRRRGAGGRRDDRDRHHPAGPPSELHAVGEPSGRAVRNLLDNATRHARAIGGRASVTVDAGDAVLARGGRRPRCPG